MSAYLLPVVVGIGMCLIGAVAWRNHQQHLTAAEKHRLDDEAQRRYQDEAAETKIQLQLSLDAVAQGVVLADADGVELYRNPYAQTFAEARHSEALVEVAITELLAESVQGKSVKRQVELFGPPRRCFVVNAKPLQNTNNTYGSVVLIDDLTEPQRLDAMRRDFVSNISHELRTPMGALSLLAETLVEESDPQVVSRLAARIQTEAIRLSSILHDLLQLSQIESNDAAERSLVDVRLIIQEALARVSQSAQDKQVTVETSLPAWPLTVKGDHRQLTSAVFNLMDNAVKYSDAQHKVWVTATIQQNCLKIEVRDQGHGIASNHQERIFERFYQIDSSRGETAGGVGLGLAIVRHVVTNHQGEIAVESSLGRGSTFTLMLPAASEVSNENEAISDDELIGMAR
ncbi:MAG: GHKL domain-containing protein [Acidimicrobiia bacterium]|nr:GHKL domain-containing protein [Acidimicrobiia bacterium]MYC57104.1 GHKL domain-containing protein [Acidimicrobiia bacterium]MYG94794.1 GHKL domain-containing protein [Acidimicrobiia bacterium]MYI30181.1 GHKL domain-containing protein [Acidimicrobiia bacterium]